MNNSTQKAETPDRHAAFGAEEDQLTAYMASLGVARVPSALDAYLDTVVAPTLQAQQRGGAVAIKFELAYLRSLDLQRVPHDVAAGVYARYASGAAPDAAGYTQLQDFLFRDIAIRAGRLGLAVHIRTGSGCGSYFDERGSDPMLLVPVLNDPALRQTNFALLHGGAPFDRHNTTLITKPNVWVDTSVLGLLYSPAELARIIRPWLETMPEHVIFGTDAGPFGPGMGWEEATWIGSRKARRALGMALTEMMREGIVTEARAKEIANRVLRQNAMEFYGWK